jgi:hypothetical protein
MRHCDKIQKLISGYSCDMLNREQFNLITQHADNCPSCRKELETYQSLDKIFGSIKASFQVEIEPSASLHNRLLAINKTVIPSFFSYIQKPAIILVGILIVVVLISYIHIFAVKRQVAYNANSLTVGSFIGDVILKAKTDYQKEELQNKLLGTLQITQTGEKNANRT